MAHDYSSLQPHARDSLELASLASSSPGPRTSTSSTSSRSGVASSRKLSLEEDDPLDSRNPARIPHNRSFSVSSAFDFQSQLFPLSSTQGNGYAPVGAPISNSGPQTALGGGSLEKHKTLTRVDNRVWDILVAQPGQCERWVCWGVADCMGIGRDTGLDGGIELCRVGRAIPLNGGPQVYLSKIFGELFGFLFTWCAVMVLKPGSSAIISIIMGEYLVRAAIGAEAENVSGWVNKSVALVGLLMVTLLNCISTRLGTKMGDMFMFMKFIALLGVTIIGIVVAVTGFSASGEANQDWKTIGWFEGTSTSASSWAVALYAGLWAFDGWDNTNYVVGEFRNPTRDLPRVIHTAMPLVILSYILANVAYFLVLPIKTLNSSNTVAVMFGNQVFGPIGSLLLALIVSASCFGALNATTFTSGRLVYVAGKEGYLPSVFGKIGVRNHDEPTSSRLRTRNWASKRLAKLFGDEETGLFFTPVYAMVLNACLTACYVFVGEFGTLVTFYGVAGYTFYFLTVLGLIVLRVREPNLERPYKTWITTPIIFCCVSLFLLSRAVFAEPLQTLIVVVFVGIGVPIYYWRIAGRDQVNRESGRNGARGWKFWTWGKS
ncbi:b(0,+)-type amino acid transporter [Lachnellula occidentalis]|uniref:B(0,+)-type amino acid transporter n=1 Tax=Lachnellula occidentalis TaxID=215460 RepID=A0A8H8S035_9HELO|nr:b(0,+)-type amino acid transporter [Lachnellula occidentalis]